jgi:hypothetical protein
MTLETGTIHEDVQGHEVDDDGDVNAFLNSFEDDADKKKRPSESDEEAPESTEETAEDTAKNTEGDAEEATEDTDPDNQEVEVKVNGETKKATLKELKRLYGQESALTQRSQKLAELQREAETLQTRAGAALKAMLEKANEANAQYAKWGPADWAQLAVHMSPEDYNALKADAEKAGNNVKFLEQELDGHIKTQREAELKTRHEQAIQCLRTLQDPTSPHHIEGFDKAPYEEMMKFADAQGVPNAREVIQPGALKILHMAMLYARHLEASKAAAKKVEKVRENPTRVLKPGKPRDTSSDKLKDAFKRMRDGDDEAGVDAFMASF